MTIEEALKNGHKVRLDFRNERKCKAFFIVFDKYTELARMFNALVDSVEDYWCDGVDYQKTLYLTEEEEEICNGIAEA